jgi:hypothetical protein
MSYGRYTNIRVQPVTPEISLQEATFVPLQKQQRRDVMYDKLSQLNYDVNRTDQDDPYVQEDINKFAESRDGIVSRLADNPFDPSLHQDMYKLSSDVNTWKTTGRGFHAQQAFNQYQTAKATYSKIAQENGWVSGKSGPNFETWMEGEKAAGRWGAYKEGELIDYASNMDYNIPKYLEANKYLSDAFKEVSGSLSDAEGKSYLTLNTDYGYPMIQITDKMDKSSDNYKNLEAALSYINTDIKNKDSELIQSELYANPNATPEELAQNLVKKAEALVDMKKTSLKEHTSQKRLQDIPQPPAPGKSSDSENHNDIYTLTFDEGHSIGEDIANMDSEEKVETYFRNLGMKDEDLTSVAKFVMGAKNTGSFTVTSFTNLLNRLQYVGMLGSNSSSDSPQTSKNENLAPADQVDNYQKFLQINKLKQEIEQSDAVGKKEILTALNKLGAGFDDLFSSEVGIPEEFRPTLVHNLATYHSDNEQVRKEAVESQFLTGTRLPDVEAYLDNISHTNPTRFKQLMFEEMDDKSEVVNDTYYKFNPGNKQAKLIKADYDAMFDIENLNLPSETFVLQNGSSYNWNESNDMFGSEVTGMQVDGYMGLGNPTALPRALKVAVTTAEGTYHAYVPDPTYTNESERSVQTIVNNTRNAKTNQGTEQLIYMDPVTGQPRGLELNWIRTSKGFTFVPAGEGNENLKVENLQDVTQLPIRLAEKLMTTPLN